MRRAARIITSIVFKLLFRVDVINPEKVPQEGPALLCANHNTLLDMFFLGFRLKRWIHWMAKEELFRNPVAAYVLKKLGAFSVKRGTGDVSSIKSAYKLLEENKLVGIFPHGTRIDPSNIETVRVKPGAVMIAVNAGVPIIPATVCGSYKLFSRMKVIFGDPFYIENKDKDKKLSKQEMSELSKDIIRRVYSLSEAYR
ncbi:MAG: 1-acyl-sn-glycerol-3-phosphate acyltransferase [Clostridiaceae bacterium]|nr:1-acyl-sn-glycerol-3-phosphate acyltransferase [Clostridiaceae bacterium]